MFSGASNFVEGVDKTFVFILGISFLFLIGLTVIMIVFAVKYRRSKHPQAVQVPDNMRLEITWTIIPIVLVLLMFYYGYAAYAPERVAPKDAMPIKVISKMWDWTFDYGNGKLNKDTLVVPIGKAIKLNLYSQDVTHSFYIPAFRIKEDVVPGTPTFMWFIAEREGIYDILCAEFCGLRHSYMEGRVKVVSQASYNQWIASVKAVDPNAVPAGLKVLKENSCLGCHSLDGSKLVGPSFKGIYGKERWVVENGKEKKVTADSVYIRNSVFQPDMQVVKDFNKGMMKSYTGILKDSSVQAIITYIKTLK